MKTAKLSTPAFDLDEGVVTIRQGGYRPSVSFTAPAVRHLDGTLAVEVRLLLFDAKDRLVGRRGDESDETFITDRAGWRHEVDSHQLDQATRLVYEINHQVDYYRKITGGEIPELPTEADGSELFPWFELDPRALEDRLVKLNVGLWATDSSIEITYRQACKLVTDSCRTELELSLLDGQAQTLFLKRFTGDLWYAQPRWDDTSIRLERKILRTLKFFELHGQTRFRGVELLAAALSRP